jgi:energy-coupling factor transporter transmembrane protein EcfT
MAELTTIGYKAGSSLLHGLDPRTKQLVLMVLSAASLFANTWFLGVASAAVLFLLLQTHLKVRQLVREIRYFLYFIAFIFIVRAVTLTDTFYPTTNSTDIAAAAIFCWRLLLVVLMGVLLISTTRTSDIRAALIWFLKPLPFVDERMAATMVGLVVRFLPLILFQAREIDDGMRARGIEKRKNPLIRPIAFTITLMRRVFVRADELVDTMQARCYNEQRTLPAMNFAKNDMAAAGVAILLLLPVLLG